MVARKDKVSHLFNSEAPWAPFAKDPFYGIKEVAFPCPVWSYNRCNPWMQFYNGFIRKGLKPVNLDPFYVY
jgi:hypothetical protein